MRSTDFFSFPLRFRAEKRKKKPQKSTEILEVEESKNAMGRRPLEKSFLSHTGSSRLQAF